MAGLGGDDVGLEPEGEEGEVADDVEDFVPDEFVGVTEGFAGNQGVTFDDDGVLEAAALDEALVHEGLDFLVEDEGAGLAEVFGEFGGVFFPVEELGEVAGVVGVGAGDLEAVVGPGGDVGAVLALDEDGLAELVEADGGVLFLEAGLGDGIDVEGAAAVADGGLVGVELDEGVIDAGAAQAGEDVLDGVDLDAALAEGGGALGLADEIDVDGDGGLVGEVDPLEEVAGIGAGGTDGQGDLVPGVEGGPFDCDRFLQSMLLHRRHRRIKKVWRSLASG